MMPIIVTGLEFEAKSLGLLILYEDTQDSKSYL